MSRKNREGMPKLENELTNDGVETNPGDFEDLEGKYESESEQKERKELTIDYIKHRLDREDYTIVEEFDQRSKDVLKEKKEEIENSEKFIKAEKMFEMAKINMEKVKGEVEEEFMKDDFLNGKKIGVDTGGIDYEIFKKAVEMTKQGKGEDDIMEEIEKMQ